MIWVDFVILGVIAISALVAYFRGFFREAIGLATWVIAFWVAFRLAEPGGALLDGWVGAHSIRLAIAFGVIFIVVLIVGAIANYFIGRLVSGTGFAGTDRVLGAVFGALRGVVVLVLLVLLAGLTPVPEDDWWHQSRFMGHLEQGALWVRDWLPAGLADEIHFGDGAMALPNQSPEVVHSTPSTAPPQRPN